MSRDQVHNTKAFHSGTHRIRRPEDTWGIIEPLLPAFGITRVADVTGLDSLGIPVVMAVRPLAKSLSVSQGKGQTPLLARISAAMESIELWHAENLRVEPLHIGTPGRDLDLPYRFDDLVTLPGGLVSEATPLDWVEATGLVNRRRAPVPVDLVRWSTRIDHRWRPPGLEWSTNGLASGNSRQEAALHALYEIVERDAISRQPATGSPFQVDPSSVHDETCARLVDRVRAAGARLDIAHLPSRFGVPCFSARIWSEDFPVVSLGWGAHSVRGIALSRAITEAAQSRLTGIAGSREDLPSMYDRVRVGEHEPPPEPVALRPYRELPDVTVVEFEDIADELDWLSVVVTEVTGSEPLLVDLSTVEEIAVVKVISPSTALDMARVHPGT
jgi:ribosomal protein S12 methylthiotransferase accessory factor